MSEPNPYESPKSEEPLQPAQVVKRGVGLAMIITLTPVAVGVAGFASCHAAMAYGDAVFTEQMRNVGWHILVGEAIAFLPPAVCLIAMIYWARRAYVREKQGKDAKRAED